ncbi:HNH endonuclease [Demequina sp. NBRC 110054]|uniref:HNH endonuclease n=1 Tax=Demequina sp. NBRC 110054 TaxID=1570343 RepID=UPI0009FDD283
MTGPIDFASRIARAETYFQVLQAALTGTWIDAYERYQTSTDRIVSGLVLVHPGWLEDASDGLPDLRGPRLFRSGPGHACQSQLVWGYSCSGSPLEVDHMFPFALGGPTRPDNGLTLCREHNRAKGHDVHLIPWETYDFPWLADQVEQVRRRLA